MSLSSQILDDENKQIDDCIIITTATGQELKFPHIQDFEGRAFLTPKQIQKLFDLEDQNCGNNPVMAYIRNHISLGGKHDIWKTHPEKCYAKFSYRPNSRLLDRDAKDMDKEMIQWIRNEEKDRKVWFIVFADGFLDYVKNCSHLSKEKRELLKPVIQALKDDFFRIPKQQLPFTPHREEVTVDGLTTYTYDWNGEQTISALTIAAMHDTKPEVLNRAINQNRKRFNLNGAEDYIEFRGTAGIEQLERVGYSDLVEKTVGKNKAQFLCYLFTYQGYMKLCMKILKDDKAWAMQENIVSGIFHQQMPKVEAPKTDTKVVAPVTNEVAETAVTHDVSVAQILYETAGRIAKLEKESRNNVDERDELVEQLRAELQSSRENGLYLTKQIGKLKRAKEAMSIELDRTKKAERDNKAIHEQAMNKMSGSIASLKKDIEAAMDKISSFENIFSAYGMDKRSATKKAEEKTVNAVDIEDAVIVEPSDIVNDINPQEPISFEPVVPKAREEKVLHPITVAEDFRWARAASGMPATELVNRFAEAAGINMDVADMHDDEYSKVVPREIHRDKTYEKTVCFVGLKKKGIELIRNYVKEHGKEHLSAKRKNFDVYKTSGRHHKAGEYSQIAFHFDGHPNDVIVKAQGFDLVSLGLQDPVSVAMKAKQKKEADAAVAAN